MNLEEQIHQLEEEIETKSEQLSELRAQAKPTPIKDYDFIAHDGEVVRLSELFGESDRLIMVYNMGRQCPYCTVWADGFSDSYHRISQKLPFVVTSKETIEKQRENIAERGWQFPMVSSKENQFLEEMGFLKDGMMYPGMALLCKNEAGEIASHSRQVFGPGDNYGMLWHVFDLAGVWDAAEYSVKKK